MTALFLLLGALTASQTTVRVEAKAEPGPNSYYVGNRAPLSPSAFIKLPLGTIRPEGWVRTQLELEAAGETGHLEEISPWLRKQNNAWLSPTGTGDNGWEEVPYWLKGFGDLGYVLNDRRIISHAKVWIDAVLAGQAKDGWLGPRSNLVANDGHPDMWPNMPMLFALQSYYDWSGDRRVIAAMQRYFKWQMALPGDRFYTSYWEKHRVGDNLASVYWLYNRTGEPWLLDLALKIHEHGADWVSGVANWHGVNFAQAFREPEEFGELMQDPADSRATESDYQGMRSVYGQVPGGMYGADENARPGYTDPHQATETCAMVEMMLSDEMLLAIDGDPKWAERCEDVAFNSLPAALLPSEKALHYLTSPNMIAADAQSKSPGVENGGPMFLFDPYDHRCCQHNVSHGWPYYAENLWYATAHNGLAVALYAPCSVSARAGNGSMVSIEETTRYPFGEHVTLLFKRAQANRFPLTLRLPSWCAKPQIKRNGILLPLGKNSGFAVVESTWKTGDTVELNFPMSVGLSHWAEHGGAVSVNRGPLTYALNLGERYVRHGGTDSWPAFAAYPVAKDWNYGLLPDLSLFKVVVRQVDPNDPNVQPFSPAAAPIEITAAAKKIDQWQVDRFGLVGALQSSPAQSDEPTKRVTLIPMGAERLRISEFPTVSASGKGARWALPRLPKRPIPASSSHTNPSDTLDALSSGLLPKSSGDASIQRFTWWDRKGDVEWVQYDFPKARSLSSAEVYWFDDRSSGGGCRAPRSWRLLALVGSEWKEVAAKSVYGVQLDQFNAVSFDPIVTQHLRLEVQLEDGFSGGVLQWRVR